MDVPVELVLIEECESFLKEFKSIYLNGTKLPLRRGMVIQPTETITKVKVNKTRTPSNTHIRIHEAADLWFEKNFGFKARSQTVFCTSSLSTSKDYGFPFFVFPAGNFEILWSRKVKDLFMDLTESKIIKIIKDVDMPNSQAAELIDNKNEINDKELYDAIASLLESFDYQQGELGQALASKNEIMVNCDHYYIAQHDDPTIKEFLLDYIKGNI